jgi:hypothetical protein
VHGRKSGGAKVLCGVRCTSERWCAWCGAENDPAEKFCGECGVALAGKAVVVHLKAFSGRCYWRRSSKPVGRRANLWKDADDLPAASELPISRMARPHTEARGLDLPINKKSDPIRRQLFHDDWLLEEVGFEPECNSLVEADA